MKGAENRQNKTEKIFNEASQEERLPEDYIAGRNAVSEALRSGRAIDKVLVAKGERTGSIVMLLAQCREKNVPVKEVDIRRLDSLAGRNHQGIIAVAACKEYASVDDIFDAAQKKGEPPFIIVCDELEDPHNLGAIVRTADAAGAHGVIIPKRRSAGLTSAVYKASAGAVEYVPVARVSNISDVLRELKKRGVWIYGLDMQGEAWCTADLKGAAAIVVGSEGRGVGRLVREQCDFILSLPMLGNVSSLNASVACGILLYEVARQRHGLVSR
ncbi:MAG: 23S rRNA (guanosine(2251)-2'-O)-methyltransferase RlmB [Oscillospiraceae bacterium]|nr:23S rRNA (guanosine(2251)-2'-O)-methyltransferase RlmB [Oscillospiraceae bacterium]MDD3833103.1 23S rRNA (guanosine(2251)-2'-O)-methyltransferase RlmB [Oscillospiraceae bacterium]MDD4546169.1 23S rRNA (guanosine(2251)-2'-O)-methyltransferase RlmB [Oscillospiraceae bacterium]